MPKLFLFFIVAFSSLLTTAQVAVRNEPRHHNVFENDYIRILDVFLAPHDTTQFHVHNTPSVFAIYTNTATGSQLKSGQPTKDLSKAGSFWYDSLSTPRIHRVWNEDSVWFHVMDIELTGGKSHNNPDVLKDPLLQLSFNEQQANGYYLQMKPGENIELPPSATGYLFLSFGDAGVAYKINGYTQHCMMKPGHYIWIDPGKKFSITNGNRTGNFLLLQLK